MKNIPLLLASLLLAFLLPASAALAPWWAAELRGVAALESTFAEVAAACGASASAGDWNFADDFRSLAFDSAGVLDLNRSIRLVWLADAEDPARSLLVAKLPADDSSVYLASLLEACAEAPEADLSAFPSGARALQNPRLPGNVIYAVPRDDDMLLLFPGDPGAVLDFPAIASAFAPVPPILPVPGILAVGVFDLPAVLASEGWRGSPACTLFPPDETAAAAASCKEVFWGLAYDAGAASFYVRAAPDAASPFAAALANPAAAPSDGLVRAFRVPGALFASADASSPLAEDGTDLRNEGALAGLLAAHFPTLPEGATDALARLAARDPFAGESAFALLPPTAANRLRAVASLRLKDAESFRAGVEDFLLRVTDGGNRFGLAVAHDVFGETPVLRVSFAEPLFEGAPEELLLAWPADRLVLSTAGDAEAARAMTLLEYPSPAAPSLREDADFAALFPDAPETLCAFGAGNLADLVAAYLPFFAVGAAEDAAGESCRAGYEIHVDDGALAACFRVEVAGLPAVLKQLSALHDAFSCVGEGCGDGTAAEDGEAGGEAAESGETAGDPAEEPAEPEDAADAEGAAPADAAE